MHVWKNMRASN